MTENDTSASVSAGPYYYIDQSQCTFCAGCSSVCPVMAIHVYDSSSAVSDACVNCGNCKIFCPVSAIKNCV